MFQKTEVLKKGLTIIEILLSGAIGLLLLLVMANAFFNFQKIGLMQNDNAKKHATFERTLMMLKSELIQAGYGLASYNQGIQIKDQSLRIQKDMNLDGDLEDSREDVVYRFFPGRLQAFQKIWSRLFPDPHGTDILCFFSCSPGRF